MTKESSNKADSSSSKHRNGSTSDTPGALFPRLHVKETRNNGPRAPPRNKMALYEQFTIPSHRFQQSQQPQQPFLPQAFAGGYYLPYYVPAFQPMNVMLQQQHNFEGGECDQGDVQRVPGGSVADNSNHLLHLSKSGSATKGKSKKTGKDERGDFAVPTYLTSKKIPPLAKEQETATTTVGNSTISTAEENQGRSVAPAASEADNRTRARDSPTCSPGNSSESGGVENQSDEDPGRSQQEEWLTSDDSETSILENSAVPQVSSKDIMSAMGDEHFWKMRKSMQRQQNIFQKQLFELHRLTKVQQLMAAAGLCDRDEKQPLQQQQQRKSGGGESKHVSKEDKRKSSAEPKVSKQPDPVIRVEESPPPPETNPASSNPTAEAPAYDYRFCPPPPPGYSTYPSFPAPNHHQHQWYGPVPVQYPYQQPFPPPPPIYNTPYGPVYGGPPPPMPFVPYSCEQRPVQDPRYNVIPAQAQQWQQQPPGYFPDPGMQWMGYLNSGSNGQESSQAPAASSAQSRKEYQSQAGSSSAGFSLIQRSSGKQMEINERQQQQQQQPPQQQKLVGKFMEAKQASSSAGKSSPYSRPSGFHAVNNNNNVSSSSNNNNNSAQVRIVKVTPKATLVTAESAAEILQSIRQERS